MAAADNKARGIRRVWEQLRAQGSLTEEEWERKSLQSVGNEGNEIRVNDGGEKGLWEQLATRGRR